LQPPDFRTQALLGRRSPGEKTRNKEHVVNDRSASSSPPSSAPAKGAVSPTAARTRLLLKGPIVPTLLRLAAPNVLNLLAFAGMITFDGFFLGRISTDALAGASLAFPWVMLILQTTNSGMGIGVPQRSRARLAPGAATAPTTSSSTHSCWRSRSPPSSPA
jgi:hypothetical protein